jgi:uncharacterized protein DUF3857
MWHSRRMTQTIFFTIFSLLFVPRLFSQVESAWQPVPKEDLALADNPANPGSSAMILERQIYTDDEKRVQTERIRIKIFTESGKSYADIEVPYLEKSTSVESIRGRTVRSDGTVIPFSGIVFDKIVARYKRFRYNVKAFTLPGVEVGSVIDYEYSIRWKERMPDYVRHPGSYSIDGGWTVPTTTWIIQQGLFTRHAVFVLRPVTGGQLDFAKIRLAASVFPSHQSDGTVRMEVSNIAAIEEEDRMPPESYLNSRVHFYYVVGFVGDYWRTMSNARARLEEKFIEKTKYLERAAVEIAPTSDPPETRLRKLYARVEQVRYLTYEPSRTEKEEKRERLPENKSADDILRHNYGSGNEINFLFAALARSAGFEAWIVQVVDRASAVFEPTVLDASQLDAMIVMVRLNGETLYFDPATRYCPFGVVPWFEANTGGIRWDKLGGGTIEVQPSANKPGTIERTADLKLQPDGGLEGTLEIEFTGQEALSHRLSASNEDEAGRRKLLEDEIKKLTPPGATIGVDAVTGWQESDQPLRIKCHVHAPRFATVTPRRMVFPMAVFEINNFSPFTAVRRVEPVYLQRGYQEIDKVTFAIPAGYIVEAVPGEAREKRLFGEFSQIRTSEHGVLRLERRETMTGYFFPLEDYGPLREYFAKLRQSDVQNVVLRKLDTAEVH